MIFCNIPFSSRTTTNGTSLARIFENLNRRKELNVIETYSLTQTSLEQIFVSLAGEDEDETNEKKRPQGKSISTIAVEKLLQCFVLF